jgi:excinuclease UvrABC nuclease subunit
MKLYMGLIESDSLRFSSSQRVNVSQNQGVYIIYDSLDRVLHVGTTKSAKKGLNQRLNNHRNGQSSFSKNYLKPNSISLDENYKFKFIVENDARKRILLEALTAGLLCPVYIGTGEKK